MFEQALDIEYRKNLVRMGQEDQIRLEEIKAAYGCRGLCEPIRLMPWLDYSTYFAYPICHNLLLGLHSQIPGNIRDKVGAKIFEKVVRETDKQLMYVRRPSETKRPTKRLLPEKSSNLFSGFKIEDHLHGMETFEPLIFYGIFENFQNGRLLKVLYFRFVSAAMFLLRGSAVTSCSGEGYDPNGVLLKEIVEHNNELILRHRRECIANIKSFCILAQKHLNPSALSPNLHALYCMIPYLLENCAHPKFEICIERMVRYQSLHVFPLRLSFIYNYCVMDVRRGLMHSHNVLKFIKVLFLKEHVRGPVRECETIVNDILTEMR